MSKVPRPKSGGTGDVFTRGSAPVPCGHGGGGVVIRQTSLSWSRDIGFTRPPVNGFRLWGHTAWVYYEMSPAGGYDEDFYPFYARHLWPWRRWHSRPMARSHPSTSIRAGRTSIRPSTPATRTPSTPTPRAAEPSGKTRRATTPASRPKRNSATRARAFQLRHYRPTPTAVPPASP